MIEFKAYLGRDYGLHFACTRMEGAEVAEEWDMLNAKSRELTGMSLGSPVKMAGRGEDPDPMSILALILDRTLEARIEFELEEISVKDETMPSGRRVVRQEKRQVTVTARLPGEDAGA